MTEIISGVCGPAPPRCPQTRRADTAGGEAHRAKHEQGESHLFPENGRAETGARLGEGGWCVGTWASLSSLPHPPSLQESQHGGGGPTAPEDSRAEVETLRLLLDSITQVQAQLGPSHMGSRRAAGPLQFRLAWEMVWQDPYDLSP